MPQIRDYTERQNRALQRIVDMMASTEARAQNQYKHLRKHDRKNFQGQVLICQPTRNGPPASEDHPSTFAAWAYSISSGGIGFLSPHPISSKTVAVGLKRPDGTIRWMNGILVRNRPIPDEDFFDFGVAFQKIAPSPNGDPKQPSAAASVAG